MSACNLGQDAKTVTSLDLGALSLFEFPPGSLRLTQQDALVRSDIWKFVLWSPSGMIKAKFATEKSLILANLKLSKPITGLIRESITDGNCSRALAVDDDALRGDSLTVLAGTIKSNIRGQLSLAGHSYKVLSSRHIETANDNAAGLLELQGSGFTIYGASIRLPGAGEVHADLEAVGSVDFSLAISTLEAEFLEGKLATGKLAFPGPIDLSINDLNINADSATANDANLLFLHTRPRLDFGKLQFARAHFSYKAFGKIDADDVSHLTIDSLSGSAELSSGIPALNTRESRIEDAEIRAKDLRIENQASEVLVYGEGKIKLTHLSVDQVAAIIKIDRPSGNPLSTAAFVATITSSTLSVSGRRDDPKIVATGALSTLQLGKLEIASSAIPFRLQRLPNLPANVRLTIPAANFDIDGVIQGNLSDGTIEASIAGFAAFAEEQLVVPSESLKASLRLSPINIGLFGGQLTTQAQRFNVINDHELFFGRRTNATLNLGEANVGLQDLKMSPAPGAPDMSVQSQASYSGPHARLGLTLDPQAAFPLLITAHFDLPGFSLTLGTIPLEVGPLEVDFQSISVSKFTIDIWNTTAALSMDGLNVGVGNFRPRSLRPGETTAPLNLRGHASTPFSIDRLSGFFDLLPLPPAFAELAVYKLHFAADNLSYIGPSNLNVTTAKVDISIPHAWIPANHFPPHADPYVSVLIQADQSNVAWNGAPNGTANIDHISIDLSGQPSRANGAIHIAASTVALSGRADIPLSTEPDGNHGCTLTVPTNVGFSMFDIDGGLEVVDGTFVGQITVNKFNLGRLNYWGHQECRWSQDAILDVPPYPCEWKWGIPTKICTQMKFDIGWVFAVQAVDMHIRPAIVVFQVADDGKFEACKYSLAELYPIVPPVFEIAPQIPIGGEIARWLNDLVRIATGAVYFAFSTATTSFYSTLSLIDFASHGKGLNFKSDCK